MPKFKCKPGILSIKVERVSETEVILVVTRTGRALDRFKLRQGDTVQYEITVDSVEMEISF